MLLCYAIYYTGLSYNTVPELHTCTCTFACSQHGWLTAVTDEPRVRREGLYHSKITNQSLTDPLRGMDNVTGIKMDGRQTNSTLHTCTHTLTHTHKHKHSTCTLYRYKYMYMQVYM